MNVSLRIRFLLFLKFKRINELHKILFTINIGRGFGRWKFEWKKVVHSIKLFFY